MTPIPVDRVGRAKEKNVAATMQERDEEGQEGPALGFWREREREGWEGIRVIR